MKNEFENQLRNLSDKELIKRFNSDVGNPGWVGARARFHSAIHAEFIRREFDFSSIGNEDVLSWNQKVKLKRR